MARTLSFVARADDMESLNDELIRFLRARCIDVEERGLKSRDYQKFAVTIAAAPMETEDQHKDDHEHRGNSRGRK